MNRLQKKCVIATAGIHLLLLTILIVGPAFYNPKSKADDKPLLTVIPSTAVDAALNSGVKDTAPPPPAPTPMVAPPPPVPVQPPQPIQPPPPVPKPVEPPPPTLADRVKEIFTPEPKPEPVKPAPEKPETQPHKVQPDLKPATRITPKNSPANPTPNSKPDNSRAINNAVKALRNNLSSPTEINLRGDSSVAYANYASTVKSVYDAAWTLPDSIAKDENITVKVTIASDGTVISSRIIDRSGDAPADASVQRTLDRVTTIGTPFPAGSTDKERTYTIVFNPQVKSSE